MMAMHQTNTWDSARALELVRKSVAREMPSRVPLAEDQTDLIKAGALDSMGWVGVLMAIEAATQIKNFGNPWPEQRPQSIYELAAEVTRATSNQKVASPRVIPARAEVTSRAILTGWGFATGSCQVTAEAIERECGLTPGTIRERAGIESVCRADQQESELTLAQHAAAQALAAAEAEPDSVGVLVTTSATHLALPSFAAELHSRLLLPESCLALDVGGACVGLIHALAIAKALLTACHPPIALVVAAEVNSRRLASPNVPGEFRGLFGDAACAFVLERTGSASRAEALRLGEFVWGCSGTFASTLRVSIDKSRQVKVQFEGEPLAQAAVTQLDRIVAELETRSHHARSEVAWFAIHEPNPRLVAIFAQKAGIGMDHIPQISKAHGNLGSATCGVSLCKSMSKVRDESDGCPQPVIFVAAVGPGVLWGGTYLS